MLLLTWTSTAIFHTSAVCGSGYSMVTPHCLTLTATQGGSLNYPKCTSKEKCNKILLILTLYLKNTTSDTHIYKKTCMVSSTASSLFFKETLPLLLKKKINTDHAK